MKKAYVSVLLFALVFIFIGQSVAQSVEDKKNANDPYAGLSREEIVRRKSVQLNRSYSEHFRQYWKNTELKDLKAESLPKDDLEVRVWRDRFRSGVTVFVLRRISGSWTAMELNWSKSKVIETSNDSYYEKPLYRKLAAKSSGWKKAWGKVKKAGLLTLPNALEVLCSNWGNDGTIYFVESRVNKTYHAYFYPNPVVLECAEAKRFLEVLRLIRLEYFTSGSNVF